MAQNLAIPNSDNLVVLTFGGAFLDTATDIKVYFGGEVYTKLLDPTIVIVDSDDQLSLNLSGTSEVGKVFVTIKRFDALSVNGTDITSMELGNLDQIVIAIGTQLIIEDGSIVENANSLVTDEEYKAFAKIKGYQVPSTQPDREAQLVNAYEFNNFNNEDKLQGSRVSPQIQTGMVPRNGMVAYEEYVNGNVIPQEFKTAQMLTALAIQSGVDTNAVQTDPDLASFSVDGVYSETYQSGAKAPTVAKIPAVTRILKPYIKAALNGGGLYRENIGYLG
jgi:hypothetical protein